MHDERTDQPHDSDWPLAVMPGPKFVHDASARTIMTRVIGNRDLELRNVQLLEERGWTFHGGAKYESGRHSWIGYPSIGDYTVTEAQIERGWVDVADPKS